MQLILYYKFRKIESKKLRGLKGKNPNEYFIEIFFCVGDKGFEPLTPWV